MPGCFRPAAGLRVLDWGEASAVVYVPHRASTHLVDGDIAAALAAWAGDVDRPRGTDVSGLPGLIAAHLEALLMAGIVEASGDGPVNFNGIPDRPAAESGP